MNCAYNQSGFFENVIVYLVAHTKKKCIHKIIIFNTMTKYEHDILAKRTKDTCSVLFTYKAYTPLFDTWYEEKTRYLLQISRLVELDYKGAMSRLRKYYNSFQNGSNLISHSWLKLRSHVFAG